MSLDMEKLIVSNIIVIFVSPCSRKFPLNLFNINFRSRVFYSSFDMKKSWVGDLEMVTNIDYIAVATHLPFEREREMV